MTLVDIRIITIVIIIYIIITMIIMMACCKRVKMMFLFDLHKTEWQIQLNPGVVGLCQ